jgi:hypothetical protein
MIVVPPARIVVPFSMTAVETLLRWMLFNARDPATETFVGLGTLMKTGVFVTTASMMASPPFPPPDRLKPT